MKTIIYFLFIPFCLIATNGLFAQENGGVSPSATTKPVRARVDTTGTPEFYIPTVRIEDEFSSEADRAEYYEKLKNYERLKQYVKKVYPLAKACSGVINDVNRNLENTQDPKQRKKYMKRLEKELFQKYEKQLRSLTITQGKILIKLINRECGASAFNLIEEYKSSGAAVAWQLVAKIFGADLKDQYDRNKEQVIETIIREIERGDAGNFKVTMH